MFDPNNPAPPQVPGQMQTMGIGGAPGTFTRPQRNGGFGDGGGLGGGALPTPGGVPAPGGGAPVPPVGIPGGANGNGRYDRYINDPRVQGIMQALQGFRDARQAWIDGGRTGERPMIRDYWTGFGGGFQGGRQNPALGALNGNPAPGQPGPATSGMYGSSMGVIGATPATSGFDLPDY